MRILQAAGEGTAAALEEPPPQPAVASSSLDDDETFCANVPSPLLRQPARTPAAGDDDFLDSLSSQELSRLDAPGSSSTG